MKVGMRRLAYSKRICTYSLVELDRNRAVSPRLGPGRRSSSRECWCLLWDGVKF